MNRFIAFSASVALLLLALPSRADSVIAEYTPSNNSVTSSLSVGSLGALGQTFTPTANGTVQTVSVLLRLNGPAAPLPSSINIVISATAGGLPTTALASTDIVSPALTYLPPTDFTADFSFAGLNLHAGELYAITLSSPPNGGYSWSGDDPGSYAGGQHVSFDGTNWHVFPSSVFDMGFTVTAKFVVPEPSIVSLLLAGLMLANFSCCRRGRRNG